MRWSFKNKTKNTTAERKSSFLANAAKAPNNKRSFQTAEKIHSMLKLSHGDIQSGRYRTLLYRFLTENIPVVNACIWTWVRLAAAPGSYKVVDGAGEKVEQKAAQRLALLAQRLSVNPTGNPTALVTFLTDLFNSLFRDGICAGFLTVKKDASGVDRFIPIDAVGLTWENRETNPRLVLDHEKGSLALDRPDFYYIPFNGGVSKPLGQSILQAIPFVSYIEQQLVDDMRRTSHNSGYHRLHVKITPPERMSGESDSAYVDRINGYFDSTVSMIKSLDVADNPVTWDNVEIEHIGPDATRSITNSWFFNHRAMIEEICSGTNLSPFLLGYSYGATTTWSAFKFDLVMRQIRSVQSEVGHLLEWIGNIDLALAGLEAKCRFIFDNTLAYQATDHAAIQSSRVDNILKLYNAGLIDKDTAGEKAGELV
jgi:hypothetical protein